jgi:hypothetical protein
LEIVPVLDVLLDCSPGEDQAGVFNTQTAMPTSAMRQDLLKRIPNLHCIGSIP